MTPRANPVLRRGHPWENSGRPVVGGGYVAAPPCPAAHEHLALPRGGVHVLPLSRAAGGEHDGNPQVSGVSSPDR